mmetsp:Transcript_65797/g.155437  ORF Transcript_65797/g.155437 Transcript_65797/m.155437 type:complete len:389 (-) Transcript_65797:43-1209(-)
MCSSRLFQALEEVRADEKRSGSAPPFDGIVLQTIRKAYGLPSNELATAQPCQLTGHPLYRSCLQLFATVGASYSSIFSHAVRVLSASEPPEALIGHLELMARGGNECRARVLMVVHMMVERAANVLGKSGASGSPSPESVVFSFLLEFLEDYKLKAFKSTFLEPAKLYFNAVRDEHMDKDVEIHGGNTYGTFLSAAMGVQLPTVLYTRDMVHACPAFLRCTMLKPFYDRLLEPGSIGRDWMAVVPERERPNATGQDRACGIPNREFLVPAPMPRTIAKVLTSRSPTVAPLRQEGLEYLLRFARCFRTEQLTNRLAAAIVADDQMCHSAQKVVDKLASPRQRFTPRLMTSDSGAGTVSVQHFFYDDDHALRSPNVVLFLQTLGFLRAEH